MDLARDDVEFSANLELNFDDSNHTARLWQQNSIMIYLHPVHYISNSSAKSGSRAKRCCALFESLPTTELPTKDNDPPLGRTTHRLQIEPHL
jgi:hypothetical protein